MEVREEKTPRYFWIKHSHGQERKLLHLIKGNVLYLRKKSFSQIHVMDWNKMDTYLIT